MKNFARSGARILLFSLFMRNFVRFFIGIRFDKNSIFNQHKQFIIVGNHNSHLDTMTVLSCLPMKALKKTHPVAAADYFGKTKLTRRLSEYFINALLIKRTKDGTGPNPIEQMDLALKSGKSILIFPEGSRGRAEQMQDFKKGIGILMAKNPQIPVIPVYMKGMGNALPRGQGLLVPFNGHILIGEPFLKESDMGVEATVSLVQQKVEDLKNSKKIPHSK